MAKLNEYRVTLWEQDTAEAYGGNVATINIKAHDGIEALAYADEDFAKRGYKTTSTWGVERWFTVEESNEPIP